MVSKQSLIDTVLSDLGDTSKSKICMTIIDYVSAPSNKKISHITYGSLRKVVGDAISAPDLLGAVQYLCGDRVNLLESRFELIQGSDIVDIPKQYIQSAQSDGILINPETGETVENYKKYIFIYFVPTQLSSQIVS